MGTLSGGGIGMVVQLGLTRAVNGRPRQAFRRRQAGDDDADADAVTGFDRRRRDRTRGGGSAAPAAAAQRPEHAAQDLPAELRAD